MADKIKFLVQKRTSLKSQIISLANALDKDSLNNAALKLRNARLRDLYNKFEDYNDELMILDPNDGHQVEFISIQERFYSLAGRIECITSEAGTSGSGVVSDEAHGNNHEPVMSIKKRRMKLPEASLPTFDGKYENWLFFKNAFGSMIGSQSDLSDIDKLHYLKSALKGETENKIKILAVEVVSFSSAWKLLERLYEVKRILISRHLAAIINMPILDRESTCGLTKLADDTQQHIAALNNLGVTVGSEIIVHLLENKLPKATLEKWETIQKKDQFPKLNAMYKFLYKTAVCASRREKIKTSEPERKSEPPVKRRREGPINRTFMVKTSRNCIACKIGRHPLYLCDKFKQLPVSQRIELVRNAKICFNCFRSHPAVVCRFSNCTTCKKRHNTLLHVDKRTNLKLHVSTSLHQSD